MEELIQKIMLKAYEVNKNTEHTVFVNFVGHVNWFEMQICLNGWKENLSPDIEIRTCLKEKMAIENLLYMLNKLEELEEKNVYTKR